MKHLTILVPDGQHNLSSIIGTYKVFTKANAYRMQQGKKELFNIQLAGLSKNVAFHGGLFNIKPHIQVNKIMKTHLIIIPALRHDFENAIKQNKKITDWVLKQYSSGAEVASVCTGAFLLASTGLLDGRPCSTHWLAEDAFQKMFPKVQLQPGKLITDENGIYTNGGAFSFLNLIIYLVEKYFDKETAVYCAKIFQIDMDRNSQSPFTIFSNQKNHQDELVKKAQDLIEKNTGRMVFSSIAKKLAVSRRNFDRRFHKATGYTPVEYQQRVKVERAKKLFETTWKNVSEVMYEVGYSDTKAFREVFRRITGLAPIEYRNKYNVELV